MKGESGDSGLLIVRGKTAIIAKFLARQFLGSLSGQQTWYLGTALSSDGIGVFSCVHCMTGGMTPIICYCLHIPYEPADMV